LRADGWRVSHQTDGNVPVRSEHKQADWRITEGIFWLAAIRHIDVLFELPCAHEGIGTRSQVSESCRTGSQENWCKQN